MKSRLGILGSRLSCLLTTTALITLAAAADTAPTPPELPVARIDGKAISYADLDSRAAAALATLHHEAAIQLQRLKMSEARAQSRELERSLEQLVDERVLALRSVARKSTPEKLLQSVTAPAPTDAAAHAFYDTQRPRPTQPFESLEPQIVEFLQGQASEQARHRYLQTLRDEYHAVLLWEPLREPVEATGPQLGPTDAKVTIVEFSDFQCPYCGQLAPILKELQEANRSAVRIIFRNLPLRTLHPNAERAARAGVCAYAQGKFWEMHDAMYADQQGLGEDALRKKAAQLGLDTKAFDDCIVSLQATAHIRADEDSAEQLGLSATPSSFVNGRFVNGTMPLYQWQALIDDEMRRAGMRAMAAR